MYFRKCVRQDVEWIISYHIISYQGFVVRPLLMGLLQLRYEHDSTTIRLRFEYDTTSYEELCAFEQ